MSRALETGMSPVGSRIPNVTLVVSQNPEQSPGGRVSVAAGPSQPLTTEMAGGQETGAGCLLEVLVSDQV